MKKVFEVYSYVFFRITHYREKKISNTNSAFSSILTMSLTFFLYFLLIRGGLNKICGITLISDAFLTNKIVALCLLNMVLLIHWYLFFKITSYEELKHKYLHSSMINYKLKGAFVLVYMILPFCLGALILLVYALFLG